MSANPPPRNPQQDWVHRAPPIVLGLIAVMVTVSLLLTFGPKSQMVQLEFWGALIPLRYAYAMEAPVNPLLLVLPPITYQFLHGGFMHLFLNSLFLLAFGTPVALRMIASARALRGSILFLAFFLISGIVCAMIYVAMHFKEPVTLIGASGSISALMAAAIRIAVPGGGAGRARLASVLDPRVMRFSMAIIGLNVLIAVLGNVVMPGGARIAWDAHISGYLFGLLCYPLFDRLAGRPARA